MKLMRDFSSPLGEAEKEQKLKCVSRKGEVIEELVL
jgi:hypothetical protein